MKTTKKLTTPEPEQFEQEAWLKALTAFADVAAARVDDPLKTNDPEGDRLANEVWKAVQALAEHAEERAFAGVK